MREFKGKTAFVTGGASGIGLAMAKAFAENGMNVMLADVEQNALDSALKDLNQYGNHVHGVACDVADPDSVERAAQATFTAFGKVHILCNNAGVAAGSGIDSISTESWRWVVDVNLMGVVYGVRSFLPHMRAHGEGGHIVNTASMAGMVSDMGFSPYAATKFAVVAMSEGLRPQIQPFGIGVSVLCPFFVRTNIGDAGRNRQQRYGQMPTPDPGSPAAAMLEEIRKQIAAGLDPAEVAARVVAAIEKEELYIFTHPNMGEFVEARFAAIEAAMDQVKPLRTK
jgi:NAD(P)-dependent dehydrogenase (short-subunit alcohol dehydrogenase family)